MAGWSRGASLGVYAPTMEAQQSVPTEAPRMPRSPDSRMPSSTYMLPSTVPDIPGMDFANSSHTTEIGNSTLEVRYLSRELLLTWASFCTMRSYVRVSSRAVL